MKGEIRTATERCVRWLEQYTRGVPLQLFPLALATAAVASSALGPVLERCGHPAVPLDDAFIHFQYAKRLATGHFFSYSEGEGYSSGATSFLWPALLAPFYAIGFRDLSIIWIAWLLGFAALFALVLETYRLALPLTGQGAAVGAGAMVLFFGGYVWCAASGMEVVPLSWVLAFSLRRSIEWWEAAPADRTVRRSRVLAATAFLAPLLRPEGAIASALFVVVVLAARSPTRAERRLLPIGVAGPLVVPVVNWLLSGQAESSTAIVKWLPGNPYYGHGSALVGAIADNIRLLVGSILDGQQWSAVFIPAGARPAALAALAALPIAGCFRRRIPRAVLVLAMALALLIPCTYATFLWNRLRYLWPFAFPWFIGLSCLARCIGELLGRIRPRLRGLSPVLSGVMAGVLGSHLGWSIDDLVQSASAIDRQQVALGRWAAAELAPNARIGMNDAGALGYLSGRKTFDVVGLTTPGEARYWVAGAGSRYEHYEALFRSAPARLPTHFIVYPHWMACDALLGDELHSETVLDQTILGGTTMTAFAARYDLLGSGDRPCAVPVQDELLDELDVADLESESAHRYELGHARETEDQALAHACQGRAVADGARLGRSFDRFILQSRGMKAPLLVARFWVEVETRVEVRVDDASAGVLRLAPTGDWNESAIRMPAGGTPLVVTVRALDGGKFGSAHYWLYRASSVGVPPQESGATP
jgi:hypothetical protein